MVVAASTAVALSVNALRTDSLPLVAQKEYAVFVPCPEPLGEVDPVEPGDPLLHASRTLVIDARDETARGQWHLPDSIPVRFDYLDPVPDEFVKKLAGMGATAIVVYGDGGEPDSGREMARELAGRGLRNVRYVKGGARALREGL